MSQLHMLQLLSQPWQFDAKWLVYLLPQGETRFPQAIARGTVSGLVRERSARVAKLDRRREYVLMKTQREALHPGKEGGSADRPIRSLKFLSVDLAQPSSGRCRATVELDRPSGEPCVGVAEGAGATDLERFRTVAQATASAILLAVGKRLANGRSSCRSEPATRVRTASYWGSV